MINDIFTKEVQLEGNFIFIEDETHLKNQKQTNEVFSNKWGKVDENVNKNVAYEFQYNWFLDLYGFESESELQDYLKTKKIILDVGCGLGYKTSWFAELAPESIVIGLDFSDAVHRAANNYNHIGNLFFVKGDMADTQIKPNEIDCVICDQVIMHVEDPEKTFQHLVSLLVPSGEILCYVYAKKALPRELIDDYFREAVHDYSEEEIWKLSQQLTQLGKALSDLNVKFEAPDIPLLGIKGGEYDIQRFIYWNFLKCFWREDWGNELCDATNFDWYSPSNAKRFSREEFTNLIQDNNLELNYFHEEEACYSGRFANKNRI